MGSCVVVVNSVLVSSMVVIIISLVEETIVELESNIVGVVLNVVIVVDKVVSDVLEPVELGGNVMTDSVVEGFTDSVIDSAVEEIDVEVIGTGVSDTADVVIVDEKVVSDIRFVVSVVSNVAVVSVKAIVVD